MSTIKVTYQAEKQEDLVAALYARAEEFENQAKAATLKRDNRRWHYTAEGIRMAAKVVENTEIVRA